MRWSELICLVSSCGFSLRDFLCKSNNSFLKNIKFADALCSLKKDFGLLYSHDNLIYNDSNFHSLVPFDMIDRSKSISIAETKPTEPFLGITSFLGGKIEDIRYQKLV
jgi:hypothetical protein